MNKYLIEKYQLVIRDSDNVIASKLMAYITKALKTGKIVMAIGPKTWPIPWTENQHDDLSHESIPADHQHHIDLHPSEKNVNPQKMTIHCVIRTRRKLEAHLEMSVFTVAVRLLIRPCPGTSSDGFKC